MILLRPWWLMALLPLAVLAVLAWRRGPEAGGWQAVLSPAMLAGLARLGQLVPAPRGRGMAPLAGAAALALALAGPALPRADAPVLAAEDAVVIAMDLSASVLRAGLEDAKAAAAQLMAALPGRPVGLVLYAGEAYVAATPTADPRVLESLIAVLDDQTMPDKASRPADALTRGAALLGGLKRADLVLISDGGGVDLAAEAEARRLSDAGVRIRALLVAGDPPGDAAALARIAPQGVYPAREAGRLAAALGRSSVERDPALRALRHRDLGPWLAALALIPLLMRFRRQA